ncbi:MAG TPA: DUF4410 domain-containing protein [Thermoanaerobaculia bacterium]|nr:DUF4410 domain-containing protein [Thermoanaerobaculia bacterium]
MRRLSFIALTAMIAGPLVAAKKAPTAPGTYKAWGPDIDELEIVKAFDASDYSNVVVQPLDVSATPKPEDADMVNKVSNVLSMAAEPFAEGIAKNASSLQVSTEEGKAAARGTLIVRGRVTLMDPGSRSKRLFIGYGAGAARTAITGEIVDAATGEVLLRFTQERLSGMERFGRGSSYEEIMKRNLHAIGKDVANILKAF